MDHLYKMVQAHPSYNKLDAVISSGDNVQVAQDEDYIKLRAALDGSLKEGTQFISCYGNHEYLNSSMGWLSQSEADALWNKYIGLEMDGVYEPERLQNYNKLTARRLGLFAEYPMAGKLPGSG